MEVEGKSLEAVFTDALEGMFKFMRPNVLPGGKKFERRVVVASSDAASLLVDFLNEALRLAQTEKEAYERAAFAELSDTSLSAALYGAKVESFGGDIKAATYHEADVHREKDGTWRARLVFDI